MKVFIAGLSRSGKTSRARYAEAQLPTIIQYISVSQLLRSEGGVLPGQTISDVMVNQRRASEALRGVELTRPHTIIDGHALIESSEGPVLVPDWFFDELAPDAIVYICDQPTQILARRFPAFDCTQLAEVISLSALERIACERIAARLSIPLTVLSEPTLQSFTDALLKCIERDQ